MYIKRTKDFYVLDYVSMFKVDTLNTCISSENVINMFEECFETMCFLLQLTLSDLK